MLPFNGARVIQGQPGTCYDKDAPIPGGRPLIVDGAPRVARSSRLDDAPERSPASIALGERLRGDALAEHASIAAFARTICQLVALGAPSSLLEKTQRALADEIAHTNDMLAWCARLGAPLLPRELPEAVAPFPSFGDARGIAATLLSDVIEGGCVGETLAAHDLAMRAQDESLPAELRDVLARTAEDEARHAALAFETAAWLVSAHPDLEAVLHEEHTRALTKRNAPERALLAPLFEGVARLRAA